jgi:thiamine-monophosphate kinase
MKIKSEWDIIAKIRDCVESKGAAKPKDLLMSIGDDCAVFRIGEGRFGLLSTDMFVENVHFRRDFSQPEDAGFKAMMANISDIAAMGGECRYALVSCGIPAGEDEEYVMRVYDGLTEAAKMAGVPIVGGDISRTGELVLSITVYGDAGPSGAILRSTAQAGNYIYCTGHIGSSQGGLEVFMHGSGEEKERWRSLIDRHTRPVARYDIAYDIKGQFRPTSMIDISDGLLSDLNHIAEESGKGYLLYGDRLPVSEDLRRYAAAKGSDPITYALKSGEEYELLFTSELFLSETVQMVINDIPVTLIGEITESGCRIEKNGKITDAGTAGYDHFREA